MISLPRTNLQKAKTALFLSLALCIGSLCACSSPNGEDTPQNTSQSSNATSANSNITVSEGLKVGATRDSLTREQYVRAMQCAAERAVEGTKFRFKSQVSAYESPLSEESFNNAMAMGDDGKYILYTQAVSLGCLGEV